MMDQLPAELANLPPPALVEELAYDARLELLKVRLQQYFDAAGIDYDVGGIETDPAQILLQVAAYQDLLLRQRINEAVRGMLLPYAAGADLDLLAQFYDVSRHPNEADARLRQRIVFAIRGRSPGGTEARYTSIALNADPRVAAVAVYTIGRDPTVRVAVYSTDNNGVADEELVAKVDDALQANTVRMVNDRIVVGPAARQLISIRLKVWLMPRASTGVLTAMADNIRSRWLAQMTIGRDLTHSWIIATAMIEGVHRVEVVSPSFDVVMPPQITAAIGDIDLELVGRDF